MRLAVCLCVALALFSIATIYLACYQSYTRTLQLPQNVHTLHLEDDDAGYILWVLPFGEHGLSSADVKQIHYYKTAISAEKGVQGNGFAALTFSSLDNGHEQLAGRAAVLNLAKGDAHKLAAANLEGDDEALMSWLLLLPSVCAIESRQRCSHVGLLTPGAPTYSNLHQINCAAEADMFQVPGLSRGEVAAVGFHKDSVEYLVSMLADMTHMSSLHDRFKRLWNMFVHCTTSPRIQKLNESSSNPGDYLSRLAPA